MMNFLVKLVKEGKISLIEESKNVSESYLEKSSSNLEAARILLKNNKLEESISFVYYSMYNLVLSLFFLVGIKSENHSASIFLLNEVFDIDNEPLVEAKKERIDKQYYVGFKISKMEVKESLEVAEDFCRDLRAFILGLGNGTIKTYREKLKEILEDE